MNCGLAAGATLVTMPRFDLELFLRAHQQYRITFCYVAPPIVVALAKHPMVAQFDLRSLRFMLSGAAPLSAELAAEAGRRIGCEIVQGYGMTELQPGLALHAAGPQPPGRLGPGRAEHRMPDRRRRDGRLARTGRRRRAVDPRSPGDARLPEPARGDRRDARRRRLAAHRRRRAHRCRRLPVHRRPAQGADQVQGLPGAAGGDRGAAADASGRSPMPR